MNFTAIFLVAAGLQVSANGFSQQVTITMKNAPVQKVLKEINRQTGYQFFYKDELLDKAGRVNIDVRNAPLKDALFICFQNMPLTYAIVDKTIILKEKPAPLNTEVSLPPPVEVRGRVTNENGEPVPGVTVTVKGTKNATATNAAGEFLLKGVAENATLVFTSTNMETQQVQVSGRTEVTVQLKTKVSSLDETKVIAYGTTSDRLRTGAVSTVTAETIEKQPVDNVLLALAGQVAGLDITQRTAIPGAKVDFNIRGLNSLNPVTSFTGTNEPLVIIDGVPFSNDGIFPGSQLRVPDNAYNANGGISALAALNPSDVERIDVLKDADATAIYGSRGANGVVLVTTKSAKQGKPRLNIDLSQGFGKLGKKLEMLNTRQYLDMRYEALANDGITNITGTDLVDWDTTRYTDWQKELLGGTAKYTRANLSFSGGTQQNSFRIATNYRSEGSIFGNQFTGQIFSGQMTFNHRSVNNRLGFDLTAGYTYNDIKQPNQNQWTEALWLPPHAPKLYNDDGSLNWENNKFNNPLADLERTQEITSQNLNTRLALFFKVTKNLTLKTDAGFGRVDFDMINLTPGTSFNPAFSINSTTRVGRYGRNITFNTSIEPHAEYRAKVGPGNMDAVVGFTVQRRTYESHQIYAEGFLSDDMMRNYGTASTITNVPVQTYDYRYNGVFARLGYNIHNRYLLTLNARRDGSSRFGPGKQFGNFGSAAMAWIFSDEPAIKKALPSFISFGKLRLSYGLTGSDAIGDYQFLSLFSVRGTLPTFNPPYTVLMPARLLNPDFAWETNRKADVELTLGFLKDRITASVNYYNNRSGNQLIGTPLPRMTGFANVNGNLGASVQNTGWEFTLNTEIVKSKNFSWNSSFNFTIPRNKLLSYPGLENSTYRRFLVIGQPINLRRVYDYVGVNPQTGVNVYRTVDGKDTSVMSSSGLALIDQHVAVDLTPKYYGGWNNNFRYKGWSLSLNMQYNYRTRIDGFAATYPAGFQGNIPLYVYNNSWRKPGDVALFPKFTQNVNSPTYYSRMSTLTEQYYSNVWYVSLSNLSLSYSLSNPLLKKLNLSSCRFYVNAQNLFILTNFTGADATTSGLSSMPRLRVIVAGVNLNL